MEEKVRVIDRAFDILEELSQATSPMSLAEICKATGLSKSTVHRLLTTMLERSFVAKTDAGAYTIGYKIIEMASTHINNLELVTEAKPFLSDLMRELDLTAHLGILDGKDVVYIEKMDGHPNSQGYTQIGRRSPAYCSSIGKCLLSGLSRDELDDILDEYEFKKYTDNTITDRRTFIKHLREVRMNGWAMDNEEFEIGHRCIGATVYDYKGIPVAAISASGSTSQLTEDKIEETVIKVKEAAHKLSKQIGYID